MTHNKTQDILCQVEPVKNSSDLIKQFRELSPAAQLVVLQALPLVPISLLMRNHNGKRIFSLLFKDDENA